MDKTTNLNSVTVDLRPASPMEIIAGWCDLISVLYGLTWLMGMIVMRRTGGDWGAAIFGAAFMIGIMWLPGMIMAIIVFETRERIGRTVSSYATAESVFSAGAKIALQRCLRLRLRSFSGICVRLALFLIAILIACDLICVFVPDIWIISLVSGAVLSLGGFFIIGFCLIRDLIREYYLGRRLL